MLIEDEGNTQSNATLSETGLLFCAGAAGIDQRMAADGQGCCENDSDVRMQIGQTNVKREHSVVCAEAQNDFKVIDRLRQIRY